ncbi:hypothetical protein [Sporofaciens musculi]|uniref:hypothetical protein n=1 Tax=Sporofaciens musculi TaxID=2681861 RepID=UPI00256FDB3E|nr:hypothetical protein [Sporofaciens musculi]
MAIRKNHFKNLFKKLNINVNEGGVSVNLNMTRFGIKMDKAQDALDNEFLTRMIQHVPGEDGGALRADIKSFNETNGERGVIYAYNPKGVPYGHYQHTGIVYADPKTGKGSFYTPEYGHWSRPGVEKVPTTRLLHYQNPEARRDWARYTAQHEKEAIVESAKNGFRKD